MRVCSSAGRPRTAQTVKCGIDIAQERDNETGGRVTSHRSRKNILVNWVSIMDRCPHLFSLRFPKEIIVVDFTFRGLFYRMQHTKQISSQQQGRFRVQRPENKSQCTGCQGLEPIAPVAPQDWLEAILSACLGIKGRGAWDACQLSPVKKALSDTDSHSSRLSMTVSWLSWAACIKSTSSYSAGKFSPDYPYSGLLD